jgi:hypothetical protein
MTTTNSINARRPLPSTPGSPPKAQNDNKDVSTPPNPRTLAPLVSKESRNSSPVRPRLLSNVQEHPGDVEPFGTEALVNQSSPPKKPPPPIPRRPVVPTPDHIAPEQFLLKSSSSDFEPVDLPIEIQPEAPIGPTSRTKVERYLTSSPAIRPALKPRQTEPNEQKVGSPQNLPTYSLSPRTVNRVTNYEEELDKLAADLRITSRPQLERTRHARQLSAAYRLQREIVISHATVQSDPSDAGSGSETNDTL